MDNPVSPVSAEVLVFLPAEICSTTGKYTLRLRHGAIEIFNVYIYFIRSQDAILSELFNSLILPYLITCEALSSFNTGLHCIFLALATYRSVEIVSLISLSAGDTLAIMVDTEFAPVRRKIASLTLIVRTFRSSLFSQRNFFFLKRDSS